MFIRQLFQSILDMPGAFSDVATADPISGVLLAVGGIITLFAVAFFGILVLGSLIDLLTPEPSPAPRQQG